MATASIYLLHSDKGEKVYVGHTTMSLKQRFNAHKCSYRKGSTTTSKILFEDYGIDNVCITLLETVPIDERFIKEKYYISQYTTAVNKFNPHRTEEEHKEQKAQLAKERWKNPEKHEERKDYMRDKVACECGMEISKNSIYKHKKREIHIQNMAKLQNNVARTVSVNNEDTIMKGVSNDNSSDVLVGLNNQ